MEKCGIVFFMKTHPPSSTRQRDCVCAGRRASHDWKRLFRRNALDLNPLLQNTTAEAEPWVYDEPQLLRLLQLVSEEISSLNGLLRTAGEPILSCEPADLLRMLGVASIRKPDTLASRLRFCLQLLVGLAHLMNSISSARLQLSITRPAGH